MLQQLTTTFTLPFKNAMTPKVFNKMNVVYNFELFAGMVNYVYASHSLHKDTLNLAILTCNGFHPWLSMDIQGLLRN